VLSFSQAFLPFFLAGTSIHAFIIILPCFLDPSLPHFLPRFVPLSLFWRRFRVPHVSPALVSNDTVSRFLRQGIVNFFAPQIPVSPAGERQKFETGERQNAIMHTHTHTHTHTQLHTHTQSEADTNRHHAHRNTRTVIHIYVYISQMPRKCGRARTCLNFRPYAR